MTKIFLTLFTSIILLTSCSATKKQFGLYVIENTADTTISKQEVSKIRSLNNDIFDTATFVGKEHIAIKYRLFKPKQQTNEAFPLVIVYHSSGRPAGTDNKSQLGILQKLFASPAVQNKYPAYVLAPQFPSRSSDYAMDSKRNLQYSTPRPSLNSVLQLIDSLKSSLNIDGKRITQLDFQWEAQR